MKRDPGLYDYLPYDRRPKIAWPNGARVAFWVAPNIEFYELDPPRNPTRAAWARSVPDVLNYSCRDYGNRRVLAHGRGDGPLRRARQRVAQCRGVRAPSGGDR